MSRRALVTGGAGFIGSHVADLYLSRGYAVTILDDFSGGKEANVPAAATVVRESIASPAAAALVRDGKFDVISHLAAQIDVRKSVNDPAWDAALNIGGSLEPLSSGSNMVFFSNPVTGFPPIRLVAGVDGASVTLMPSPGAAALLSTLALGRRRRN